DIASFNNDVDQLVKDSIKLMAYPGYVALDAVFSGLGEVFKDQALGKDFEGMWDALISGIAETIAAPLEVGTMLVASGAALSVDAIALIANIVVNVANPAEVSQAVKDFGYDMVSSILANVTFTIGKVKETLQDLITTCGYLIKLLTDVIVDVGASVDALARYAAQGLGAGTVSFKDYYAKAQTEVASHQRLISSLVTTGLIVGLTVVTAGTGAAVIPGLVMALGMGALMTTGAYQDDEKVAQGKQELHDYVENFNVWTVNKEAILQAQKKAITGELNLKLQSEIDNRRRDLGFYQNFLDATFNGVAGQNSAILGAYQASKLMPDENGIINADVAAPYGYSTGWLELAPSQGFALYQPARGTFSQEIAAAPARFKTEQGSQPRFWFTQTVLKELVQPSTQELLYEIRFRGIYSLDTFYAGIYLGGNPINIERVKALQKADPNQAHLAKAIVFKKETAQGAVELGIYEHESKLYQSTNGWIPIEVPQVPWSPGKWYRIKARLAHNL
ncbi:MAG TPA: hypothetical protein VHA52_00650, partial [Candidatus Babeliaceae bacterium]|nr:hypothetical protein [Candidatus Babeliaceae bacterium]